MNSYPDPQAEADPEAAPIVYEQPLNERMRTFLRLEFLYTQASYHSESPNPWSSRAAISSLLEILAITARGDSRSDVLKELERHVNVLKEYQTKTGVDPARLKSLMSNLVKLRNDLSTDRRQLHGAAARLGVLERHQTPQRHPRRHLRFRFAGLLLLAEPARRGPRGGVRRLAGVDPAALRQHRGTAVADPAKCQAQIRSRRGGIFQLQFDRENPCQLVRVTLPADTDLFPEISGSQHRCTIRFLNWLDATSRPVHVEMDVPFLLTCCA